MAEFMSVNDGMLSVPLTVIKKDDGSEAKVLCFDKAKLEMELGL